MKPTAVLVNTARGPIVEDAALHRALTEGWIAVWDAGSEEEPPDGSGAGSILRIRGRRRARS
ncbi:NAD(P)-dependent oxidoreductase [Spirillospora sp. NPDC127506]